MAAAPFESKFEALFDQASDAIVAVRPDGQIDAVNQAAEELTLFLRTELINADVGQLAPTAERMKLHPRAKGFDPKFLRSPGTYEDIAVLRKDGYVRFVDLNVREVMSGKTRLVLALFRDLTEKKRMERELITKHTELREAFLELERKNAELQAMQETLVQSGKMAALGELAAGIAHELNQPLQGVRGYAQELQAALPAPDAVTNSVTVPGPALAEITFALREIISNVDKGAQIISYLRAFVRKSTESYEFADVHLAIEEALKMLNRQFASRGITVERKFAAVLSKVYGNPLQLEQVFINLASNARDAIEATGRGSGAVSISTCEAGDFVEVMFRDDGCGMTTKTKTKVFNPFFTTKEVGKGMGLGLSLSYGILSKLHGSMVVESEIGKGAAFLIRIPKDFRELA